MGSLSERSEIRWRCTERLRAAQEIAFDCISPQQAFLWWRPANTPILPGVGRVARIAGRILLEKHVSPTRIPITTRSRRSPRVPADAPAFPQMPPYSRRCPRVHAVGVSPSPYAPAEIVFSGRVHRPVTSRRVPRPPRNGRCLVPARSAPGCCGLGECRCVSLFWTRPRTCHRPCTRGSAAKRGSPRAMHERPSRPKNRDRTTEGISSIGG